MNADLRDPWKGVDGATDRYLLKERIGAGATGEVYRATAQWGIDVAIKRISLTNKEAAWREYRWLDLIKVLRHAFLTPVHEFWVSKDRLWVVMELADASLRDWSRRGPWNTSRIVEICKYISEAGEALDFLHAKGVLHRDVKPDNILLVGSHAKVGDCGLARLRERQWLTGATLSGTPTFMAPEAWEGNPDFASDQYALAATYVEARRGKPLFVRDNLVRLMRAHRLEEPELDGLSNEEQEILLRALAKKPGKRYATCSDFAAALREAAPHVTAAAACGRVASGPMGVATILDYRG